MPSAKADSSQEELRSLLGEHYEKAKLLTAEQVSDLLEVHERSAYDLRIPRVRLSRGRVRWSLRDVLAFQDARREAA